MGRLHRTCLDAEFHSQAPSRAFSADKHGLCDQTVRVTDRWRFFDAVVTPVALYGAGHRTIHKRDLRTVDCAFRNLLRKIIRLPGPVLGMKFYIFDYI